MSRTGSVAKTFYYQMEPPKKITIHLNPNSIDNEVVKHRIKGSVHAKMKKFFEKKCTTQEVMSSESTSNLIVHGFVQLIKSMLRSRTYISWVGLYQRNMAVLMMWILYSSWVSKYTGEIMAFLQVEGLVIFYFFTNCKFGLVYIRLFINDTYVIFFSIISSSTL